MAARGKRQVPNSDDSRLTFDEVANQHGGRVSEAPAITVKAHPEVIRVLPNMTLEMQANPFTPAIGDPAQSVPWRLVQRSLRRGHRPIVIGTLKEDELVYEQVERGQFDALHNFAADRHILVREGGKFSAVC